MTEPQRSLSGRPRVLAFLAEHPRGVLGWIDGAGGPRQVPVWVTVEGDRLLFNGPAGGTWADRVATDRRASILVPDGNRSVECRGVVDIDTDPDRARAVILDLTRRVYPATSRPEMTQDLFRGSRLAVFSLVPAHWHTLGLGR